MLLLAAALLVAAASGCTPAGITDEPVLTAEPTAESVQSDSLAGEAFSVDYSDRQAYRLSYIDDANIKRALNPPKLAPLGDRYIVVSVGYASDADDGSEGDVSYLDSVSVYDLYTGKKLLNKKDLFISSVCAIPERAYFIENINTLYVIDSKFPDKFQIYDLSKYLAAPDDDFSFHFDGDTALVGNTFYYTLDRSLYSVDLDTMERKTIFTVPVRNYMGDIYSDINMTDCSNSFYVSFTVYQETFFTDYNYVVYQDGTYQRIDVPTSNSVYITSDYRLFMYDYSASVIRESERLAVRSMKFPENTSLYDVWGDQLITSQHPDGADMPVSLVAYSFDRGEMTMRYELPEASDAYNMCFALEGKYIIFSDYGSNITAIPCDRDATVPFSENNVETVEDEPADYNGNHARAQRISREYGVMIHIYDDAIIYFGDYAAVSMTDDRTIQQALITVEECLSQYPKDFFAELTSFGDLHELHIMMVGRLIRGDETSTSYPIGYASSDYKNMRKILAVDISSGELKNTIFHEIMHYIDEQSYSAYFEHGIGDGLQSWNSYNPYGFSYHFSYVDENGNDYNDPAYTISFDDDPYFIDEYCKTFATEDRARTFEAIMGDRCSAADYPHIKAKMKYLVTSIQGTFTTWKDLDQFEWYNKLFDEPQGATE